MKKFLAIFAAVAIAAAAGFAVVHNKMNDDNVETNEITDAVSEAQQGGSYSGDSQTDDENSTQPSEQSSDEASQAVAQNRFNAKVDTVSGMMLIVAPDENSSEYKSSDKITFSLDGVDVVDENGKAVGYDDITNFESADVFYSGGIKETYPAQIDARKVVLSGKKYCNVSFVINGDVVKTMKVRRGDTVDAADMPNAGAYCADGYHFECWLDGERSVSFVSDISDDVTLTAKISKD